MIILCPLLLAKAAGNPARTPHAFQNPGTASRFDGRPSCTQRTPFRSARLQTIPVWRQNGCASFARNKGSFDWGVKKDSSETATGDRPKGKRAGATTYPDLGVFRRFELDRGRPSEMDEREWHYHVLGLDHGASAEEAKAAFRKLTLIHHPDRKGGCTRRFLQIRDAMTFIETERMEREKEKEKSGVQDWWRGTWTGQLSMLGKRKPNRATWYEAEAAQVVYDRVESAHAPIPEAPAHVDHPHMNDGMASSVSVGLNIDGEIDGTAASSEAKGEERFVEELQRLRWQSRLRGLKAREKKIAKERAKSVKKLGEGKMPKMLPPSSSDQLF
uniref:J domain-containing protein n=2 Tax=Lotharella globosa TaxID=91324 RepID=A0A7S3YDA0_9EUKA|mmetsp:Transcript_21140/g.42530  ORF Transcript_21140/g.42530 Transcript_21140/m.42530 type:complete len:329 (-) Transcript_21140:318-1304(-)